MLLAGTACSTDFTPQPCGVDSDCGKDSGLVCEIRGQATCVRIEDATLRIGQSAPLSGTNQALGTAMKSGIELAFDEKNAAGGIRGRKLELVFRDDAYQPALAEVATKNLLDVQIAKTGTPNCPTTSTQITAGATPVSTTAMTRGANAVLAILGNVGTPTMIQSAPVAIETHTVFFGAFTGSSTLLRDKKAGDTCSRYIFNYRASYAQETQAAMEYFKNQGVTNYKNLISFDQQDAFGQSGYDGLVAAYKNTIGEFPLGIDTTTPIKRHQYMRNDEASVPIAATATEGDLTQLLTDQSGTVTVGILMTDTYGAGASYITALRTWQYAPLPNGQPNPAATRLKLLFSNISFVGANSLSDRLTAAGKVPGNTNVSFTDDVVVTQVVPNYQTDKSDIVAAYNHLVSQDGSTPSFTSLEGYIAARVFIAGLELHQGPFTASSIVDSFEALPNLGLGIGASAGFSPDVHQYSGSVWGTILKPDGSFKDLYFWSGNGSLQLNE